MVFDKEREVFGEAVLDRHAVARTPKVVRPRVFLSCREAHHTGGRSVICGRSPQGRLASINLKRLDRISFQTGFSENKT